MTTECTWTELAQPRHDTQQWSREPSIARAILNACGFQEITTKWEWTKTFLCQKQFLWKKMLFKTKKKKKKSNFLRRSNKSHFFRRKKKRISKNKFEKWWKNSFSVQMSNNRNSENIFLEGFKQVFWGQKKRSRYLVWKNKIEKKKKEKSETKKTVIEQKKFYKKGWTNEKSFVFREK